MRPGSYSGPSFARGDELATSSMSGLGTQAKGRRASQPASASATPTARQLRSAHSPALIDAAGVDGTLPQFVSYTGATSHTRTGAPGIGGSQASRSGGVHAGISVSATTVADAACLGSKSRSLHASLYPETSVAVPADDLEDEGTFADKRRLPSILLDSWELRKIAPEGSVLPNALVSWDVDGDGVEEILLGTTEGHFFILKPDCRMPVYAYMVSATISVVLYSEQMRRLVLITLEGQCEVFENFPVPPTTPVTRTRAGGAALSRSASGTTATATTAKDAPSEDEQAARASSAASARAALLRSKRIPQQASVSSLNTNGDGAGSNLQGRISAPSAVFHVASNCLCADMSTETDHRDLLFLGSCDSRLYVYSIDDGTCLLSLFMHQPITCLKTFSLPCQVPLPSGHFADEDEAGDEEEGADETPLGRSQAPSRASADVPLLVVTTSTSVVLLPAAFAELQRWRRQEKRTGRPLTLADSDTIQHCHDKARLRKSAALTRSPTMVPSEGPHTARVPASDGPPRPPHASVAGTTAETAMTSSTTLITPWASTTSGGGSVTAADADSAAHAPPPQDAPARPVGHSSTPESTSAAAAGNEARAREFTRPPMTLLQPLLFAQIGRDSLVVPPALSREDMASGRFGVLNAAKRHRGRTARPPRPTATTADDQCLSDDPSNAPQAEMANSAIAADDDDDDAEASRPLMQAAHEPDGAKTQGEGNDITDTASWLPVSVDVSVGEKRAMMVLSSEDGRAFVVSLTPLREDGSSALAPTSGKQCTADVACALGGGGDESSLRTAAGAPTAGSQHSLAKGTYKGTSARHEAASPRRTVVLRSKHECTPRGVGSSSARHGVSGAACDHQGPLSPDTASTGGQSSGGHSTKSSSNCEPRTGARCVRIYHDVALPLPPTVRQFHKKQRQPVHRHAPQQQQQSYRAPASRTPLSAESATAGGGGEGNSMTSQVPVGAEWGEPESPLSNGSPTTPTSTTSPGGVASQWTSAHHTTTVTSSSASAVSEMTLRLQCEWRAHLGPMPLVQRARIFVAEGQDAFTVVLVAANGRCYSLDPDTATAVECTVKADCSSFTLVAGNSCVAGTGTYGAPSAAPPGLSPDGAASGAQGRTSSGLGNRVGALYMATQGGSARPVFCVCVSVDELCLYSVGEAHNTSATPFTAAATAAVRGSEVAASGGEALANAATTTSARAVVKGATADIFEGGAVCDGMRHFTDVHDERELLLELGRALIAAGGGPWPAEVEAAQSAAERDEQIIWMSREILTKDYSPAEWKCLQRLATADEL